MDDIITFTAPSHIVQKNRNDIWAGSYIPALTQSSCCSIGEEIFLFGGFSFDNDKTVSDMWKVSGIQDGEPDVTLIAGPDTVRRSQWTEEELTENNCLVQKGLLPGSTVCLSFDRNLTSHF